VYMAMNLGMLDMGFSVLLSDKSKPGWRMLAFFECCLAFYFIYCFMDLGRRFLEYNRWEPNKNVRRFRSISTFRIEPNPAIAVAAAVEAARREAAEADAAAESYAKAVKACAVATAAAAKAVGPKKVQLEAAAVAANVAVAEAKATRDKEAAEAAAAAKALEVPLPSLKSLKAALRARKLGVASVALNEFLSGLASFAVCRARVAVKRGFATARAKARRAKVHLIKVIMQPAPKDSIEAVSEDADNVEADAVFGGAPAGAVDDDIEVSSPPSGNSLGENAAVDEVISLFPIIFKRCLFFVLLILPPHVRLSNRPPLWWQLLRKPKIITIRSKLRRMPPPLLQTKQRFLQAKSKRRLMRLPLLPHKPE